MTRPRRLSQAISEGDGISVIVRVADAAAARAAEAQGAEGIVLTRALEDLRAATGLPILFAGEGALEAVHRAGADAYLLVVEQLGDDGDRLVQLAAEARRLGLEPVIDVHDEEELELALERVDPEIFLISPRGADDDDDPLERVLHLLPDVPAGKLAIADLAVTSLEEVAALERAGFDAVLVAAADVAGLVGGGHPRV